MHRRRALFNCHTLPRGLALMFCLAIASCGDAPPSGQVMARVGGEDVTVPEFEFEVGRRPGDPPSLQDNAHLEIMLRRTALAQIAKDRGLEQDPKYHFALQRARDELLVDALYRRLQDQTAEPGEQEIAGFMEAHPWQFTDRRVLELSRSDKAAESALTIDTAEFSSRPPFPIMEIAAGQDMLWRGEVYRVSRILALPIEAEAARQWAARQLRAAKVEDKVAGLYNDLLASGRLQYAPGYGPSREQGRARD